jgi:hypothetical protein
MASSSPWKSTMLHAFFLHIHSKHTCYNFQSDALHTTHDKHASSKKKIEQLTQEQIPSHKMNICLRIPMFLELDLKDLKREERLWLQMLAKISSLIFTNQILNNTIKCCLQTTTCSSNAQKVKNHIYSLFVHLLKLNITFIDLQFQI